MEFAGRRLPVIRGSWRMPQGGLWVLLGGYRADLAGMLPDSLSAPVVLDPVPAGIAADLLTQRPDVGAAWQRMEAARYAVGARRADLLPSLSLSGSIGLQGSETNQWFDASQWFKNLTLNLAGPAFRQNDCVTGTLQRLCGECWDCFAYKRSVVAAVNEVESVLAQLEASYNRHALLTSSVEEARAESAFQERRYRSGVGDYDDYLAASETLSSVSTSLVAAERDLGYMRLALHRALGGTWIDTHPDNVQISNPPQAANSKVAALPTE